MDDLLREICHRRDCRSASDEAALEDLRLAALGKKGEISLKMRELGQMAPAERQVAGAALNALKRRDRHRSARQEGRTGRCGAGRTAAAEWLDVTLPGGPAPSGDDPPGQPGDRGVTAIFADMGFAVAEGPQIESDWYQFRRAEHPARTSGAAGT
jgi:phenylalanyl-tRNA synthetase alpha chain